MQELKLDLAPHETVSVELDLPWPESCTLGATLNVTLQDWAGAVIGGVDIELTCHASQSALRASLPKSRSWAAGWKSAPER